MCYRTVGSQQQIIVGGLSAAWNADFMTTNGTVFASPRRDNSYGCGGGCHEGPGLPLANARAAGGGDVFWDAWFDNHDSSYDFVAVGKLHGAWPATLDALDLRLEWQLGHRQVYRLGD